MNKTKGVITNTSENELSEYISETLSVLRETLLDLSDGHLCVATVQGPAQAVEISTRRPISFQNLKNIQEKVGARLPKHNRPARLKYFVNGQSHEHYTFDRSAAPFQRQLTAPLVVKNKRIGFLYVGSFDKRLNLRQTRLIRKLALNLPRSLGRLMFLNHRQNEKIELLAARTIEGLILCDSRKRIHFINTAARRLLGVSLEENFIGETLDALKADYLIEFIDEARRQGLNEVNKVVSARLKHPMLIGAHIELLKNARNSEVGWMIDLRDVTRNWQNDQLRSVLTLASHEIKTPLSSIKGAIDLLLENDLGKLNDKQKHCLHVIKDDIVRLNRLLSDILDLSRFDEGIQFLDRRKEISLPILIHKATESFKSFARSKNIKIENKVSRTIPTFKGPRDRLQQVLANLLENGIKYTLPGGRVTMEADLSDNQLTFVVKDTGVGIPSHELENIFQRFKQLDNYPGSGKQGFGLGLSISKEIIEAMGGKIWVESQPGVGSSFYFKIPI